MTDLTTMAAELEALLERLRLKRQVMPMRGGGSLSMDGQATSYITDDGMRHVNPDGPAAADAIDTLLAALKAQREALEPFAEAMKDFEAECFFGCLGEDGAGVVYPDETRFALVHSVDNTPRFNGGRTMDDAPDDEFGDIGSFTLGDLRRARTALEGKPAS